MAGAVEYDISRSRFRSSLSRERPPHHIARPNPRFADAQITLAAIA